MARLRPYIVRATYEWLIDHDFTPYVLVDAEIEGVEVPWDYVEEGKIVLNLSPAAVYNFQLENDFIGFEASFSGEPQQIFFPMDAVLALYAEETEQGLYAHENGVGMLVNEGEEGDLDPTPPTDDTHRDAPSKVDTSRFRVIK